MTIKNRFYIIVTGVVAITLIWLSQSNRNQTPKPESLLEDSTKNNIASEGSISTLEGTLWSSDNKTKGNLMLVNSNATIYIRTSRDFGGLGGKRVIISVKIGRASCRERV